MFKLLIVDDETVIQQGLYHLVDWNELNIQVVGFASNGQEALEFIDREHPHMMITDMRMPVLDGLGLLKSITEKDISISVIVLSGYDDFPFVKAAMKYKVEDYLLKPIDKEELTSTLNTVIDKLNKKALDKLHTKETHNIIRTNVLNRLITNHINEIEMEEKAEFLQIKLPRPPCRVGIIKLLEYDRKKPIGDFEQKIALIENTTAEQLSHKNAGLCFQSISGAVILLLDGCNLSYDGLKELLDECLLSIKKSIDEDVLITIGRPVDDINLVSVSYEDAHGMLDYRHIRIKNWILFHEDETKRSEVAALLNIELESFENSMLSCRKDKTFEFIDVINSDHSKPGSIKPQQIMSYFMSLMACCFSVSRRMKLDIEALMVSQDPIERVLANESGRDLSDWLKSFVDRIIDNINAKKNGNRTQIDIILEFVNKKYATDLSLQQLATEFGLSSPYLGTLFKNHTGEIFSVYLNKLRVEKAKDLLLSTTHSASEISKLVGYWDSNYFYKVFKKYTGVFPTQFRRV